MLISEFLMELSGLSHANVVYFQSNAEAKAGELRVNVGCGRWQNPEGVQSGSSALLLTNKGSARRFGWEADLTSVTKFVAESPEAYLEGFALWQQRPISPIRALEAMTIVADDASPDSVFAMIIFLARLAAVEVSEFPSTWIETVDRWEQRGLSRDPEKSWCVLESSLAHRSFPLNGELSSDHMAKSWRDALRFAAHCLKLRLHPENVPELPECSEYIEAKAALEQEREVYRLWLERANPVQVSVPLRGTADRHVVVDGLFIEARQITGATKVFFRTDRKNSHLKNGFPFAAICAPAKGDGEIDITISVDPSRGLDLRELWEALEKAESNAWELNHLKRPCDQPRIMEGVNNSYNEPWYIAPDATLIGRPYRLKDGSPGSLLSWSEVAEIIWLTLNPLRSVQVVMLSTAMTVPILQLEPENRHGRHDKLFFAAKWLGSENDESLAMPPRSSPTFSRTIAGLLERRGTSLTFANLPHRWGWETIDLNGGIAILTSQGIVIIDDASPENVDIESLRRDFDQASELDERLSHAEAYRLRPLALGVKALLQCKKGSQSSDELLVEAALLGAELAEMRGNLAMLPDGGNARMVRLALEKHWSLDRRFSAFESEVSKIEASLRSLNEVKTLRIGRFIASYGFALVFAASLAPFLSKAYYHWLHGGPDMDAPGRLISVWFVGLASMLVIAIRLWFASENPIGQKNT